MQSILDRQNAKINSEISNSLNGQRKIESREVMQLDKQDMDQLREQLRIRGQPLTNAVL